MGDIPSRSGEPSILELGIDCESNFLDIELIMVDANELLDELIQIAEWRTPEASLEFFVLMDGSPFDEVFDGLPLPCCSKQAFVLWVIGHDGPPT
jgi:hypothetical protein